MNYGLREKYDQLKMFWDRLLNWNGNLLANTFPEETNNGLLRIKQYEKHIDSNTRIKIEEQIVIQKLLLSVRTIIKIL